MTKRRIAVAGFQHETNTFAPFGAGIEEFRRSDSWPGLLLGKEVIDQTVGMNLPISGAVQSAQAAGRLELIPILWCQAEPSGPVTDKAFEWVADMLLDGIRNAGPLDGIYLDLHGAMVTERFDDGEAALLKRIRSEVGTELSIGVSLDLHANVSEELVELADVITIYRTYPHLDMAETGARCMRELVRAIDGLCRKAAFRQAPFLVPLHAQYTGENPCKKLYTLLDQLPESTDEYVELAMGFTAADIADCGPSVIAYSETKERASALADEVMEQLVANESQFDTQLLNAEEAVMQAIATDRQVVLSDVQDNAGAGASSDTTGLLHALVSCAAPNALLGVLCDREICQHAHAVGEGGQFHGAIGGRTGLSGETPFVGAFKVLALSDGIIAYTGAMYGGSVAEIGPSCLLSIENTDGDIRIVVSTDRTQCLDRALFTHFGANPAEARIVCVKSTVHHRADFETEDNVVMNVAAPGMFPCKLDEIDYRKLRNGVRLGPNGPVFHRPGEL